MANEFQLTTNTQAAADFWTQGGQQQAMQPYVPPASGYTGGPPASGPVRHSPVVKAHRLLRGRYPLAIFLAASGALAGGLGGWMALPPKFESTGLVNINPIVATPGPVDQTVPMLAMFIQGQVGLLTSTHVAEAALQDKNFIDAWEKNYSTPLPSPADFDLCVNVEHVKNGPLISVAFDDRKKEVAEAGTHALLTAYVALHGSGDEFLDVQKKMDYNNQDLATQEAALAFKRKELDALAEKYGTTDLQSRDQQMQGVLSTLEGNLAQAKIALDAAVANQQGKAVSKAPTDKEFIYQQIAGIDNGMAGNLRQRENCFLALQDLLAKGVGPKHPTYLAAAQLYADSQKRVDDYAKDFLVSHQGRIPFQLDDPAMGGQNIDLLKQRVDSMQKMVEQTRLQAQEIGSQRQQIEDVRAEITQISTYRDRDLRTLEELRSPGSVQTSGR